MAPPRSIPVPPGFHILGINSSLYTPPTAGATQGSNTVTTTSAAPASQEPFLVILCSWMGASPKNIAKYTTTYQQLLPNATILLIQSEIMDMTWRSLAAQEKNMAPATAFVSSFMFDAAAATSKDGTTSFTANNSPVILHIFSHGGSNSALRLLRGLQTASPMTPSPLPLRAFILDSTPGDDGYARAAAAATVGLPRSGPLRWLGLFAIHFTLLVRFFLMWTGFTRGIKHLRAALLDEALFSRDTERMYAFSKADVMIDWRAAKGHAEEARAKGWRVREEVFEGSPHCGHIREDEGRYWGGVKAVAGLG